MLEFVGLKLGNVGRELGIFRAQFLQLLALQLYGYDHFGDARVVVEAGVSEAPGRDGAASRER